jgi:Domain of Unknown Function (DUF1080)
MKRISLLTLLATAALIPALHPQGNRLPFTGRWDLTIKAGNETYPSWMECTKENGKPAVRVVGRVASVHPAQDVRLEGNELTFTTQEYFGKEIPVTWEFHEESGKLSGKQKRSDGVTGDITAESAPTLNRPMPAHWTKPEPLFNGKDLSGWEPFVQEPGKPVENHYVAKNGELVNEAPGANIRTTRKFSDFKLHVEYNCPQDGNSGVYLRGRYEVQVEYEPAGENDAQHSMGSIYGFLAPAAKVSPRPGQWESYDITLVGRTVTIVRNGVTIISNQKIPGITGGALDSHEGEPGPIYIQGDHTGGMKYRNITISVPQT